MQTIGQFDTDKLQSYIDQIQKAQTKYARPYLWQDEIMQSYAEILKDVDNAQAALLLSTQGLNNAQIQQTLSLKGLSSAEQYEAMTSAGLLKNKQSLTAAELKQYLILRGVTILQIADRLIYLSYSSLLFPVHLRTSPRKKSYKLIPIRDSEYDSAVSFILQKIRQVAVSNK